MSKLAASTRIMSSGLFALVAVGAAMSAIGCAKPEEEKKASWSCTRDEVPMGEVVRCTTSAVTADGPVVDTGSTTETTSTSGDYTDYSCDPEQYGADCPPPDATGGDGSAAGTDDSAPAGSESGSQTDTGAGGAAGTSGSSDTGPVGSESGSEHGNGNGGAGSSSGGHTTDGSSKNGSENGSEHGSPNGNAGGGTSHERGPDECAYVPDLDYCGGGAGSSSSGASSSGDGTSSGTDCTKQNCSAPGQEKKKSGGTTDGAGASSSSGGGGGTSDGASGGATNNGGKGGGKGGGKSWKCTKDGSGNKTCVSTPDCAPGTHASACGACESDSDGPTCDCVPPSEGGCWITGGGYIEGASIVPAAAADGHDNFGGNAKPMKKGGVSGHWNHVDHGTGNHAKGRPEYIMCRVTDGPGPKQPGGKKGLTVNQVYFGGHAQWRDAASATWSDGYWFDVVAEDHGEPGNTHALKGGQMPDSYHFSIRKIDDPTKGASGVVVYETRDDLRGGNIQIHPSNPGHPAVNSPLPAWVSIEQ